MSRLSPSSTSICWKRRRPMSPYTLPCPLRSSNISPFSVPTSRLTPAIGALGQIRGRARPSPDQEHGGTPGPSFPSRSWLTPKGRTEDLGIEPLLVLPNLGGFAVGPGVGGVHVDHRAFPHVILQLIEPTALSTHQGCQKDERNGQWAAALSPRLSLLHTPEYSERKGKTGERRRHLEEFKQGQKDWHGPRFVMRVPGPPLSIFSLGSRGPLGARAGSGHRGGRDHFVKPSHQRPTRAHLQISRLTCDGDGVPTASRLVDPQVHKHRERALARGLYQPTRLVLRGGGGSEADTPDPSPCPPPPVVPCPTSSPGLHPADRSAPSTPGSPAHGQ